MKRGEKESAINQFPKCSPPSRTHRDSQSWVEKKEGRKETEATWSPKWERAVKPVILLPSKNGY